MPSDPQVLQNLGILRGGECLFYFAMAQAFAGERPGLGAVLAAAVCALKPRSYLRELLALFGFAWGGHGQRQLQQLELASQVRRHVQALEALRLFNEARS